MVYRPAVLYHVRLYTERGLRKKLRGSEVPIQEGDAWKIIVLLTDAYEVDNIDAYLKRVLVGNKIILRPSNKTLKCELSCSRCSQNIDLGAHRTAYGV